MLVHFAHHLPYTEFMAMNLTEKQRKFIAAYNGNGVEAARAAGYDGDYNALGVTANRLLKNAKIRAAIDQRINKDTKHVIASREERQAFWTQVLLNQEEEMRNRLKASELLGKSQADFTEKIDLQGKVSLETLIVESLKPKQ